MVLPHREIELFKFIKSYYLYDTLHTKNLNLNIAYFITFKLLYMLQKALVPLKKQHQINRKNTRSIFLILFF